MSREELAQSEKGKILQVQHVIGDLLFKLAPPITFPPGYTATTCEPLDDTEVLSLTSIFPMKAPQHTSIDSLASSFTDAFTHSLTHNPSA